MAKFGAYYGLCPLTDHHNLTGITKDCKRDVVLVTLKNIAVKYKLSDQKQICSWRTKAKFSAPIIYDSELEKYATCCNQTHIKLWNEDVESLDKVKKYKFAQQIYSLFVCNNRSYVLFKNGAIMPLKSVIEDNKKLVLKDVIDLRQEYINDFLYIHLKDVVYVCLIINGPQPVLLWTTIDDKNETSFNKVSLQRLGDHELTGYLLHNDGNRITFFSLWSDNRMYSCVLKASDSALSADEELFTVMDTISAKYYVSMVSLDENYIALYGGNCNDEGAILIIYNIQFKVIQSRLSVKMFTKGAKLWHIDDNLFLPMSQNLAVVPFHLATEQLASLVGSHKPTNLEDDVDVRIVHKMRTADWGYNLTQKENSGLAAIKKQIADFIDQGLTEGVIFEEQLPKLFEKKDLAVISQYVNYFSDIPEKCLVKLLKFFLTASDDLYKKGNHKSKLLPQQMQPLERTKMVDAVLTKHFSDVLILKHLRFELDLQEVVTLLEYIYFVFSADTYLLPSLNSVQTGVKLIQWGSALLDANYQKLILSTEPRIKDIVNKFNDLVNERLSCLDDLNECGSIWAELWKGKSVAHNVTYMCTNSYFVEEVNWY